jgi:hypothetical protein
MTESSVAATLAASPAAVYCFFLADADRSALGGVMLTCKATFKLSKADDATTETLHFEASTHDELLGKIRAYAESANRKGLHGGQHSHHDGKAWRSRFA